MGDVKYVFNFKNVESVPESFVVPPEKRPGVPLKKILPMIDLATPDRALLVQKFLDTSQEFEFFQVVGAYCVAMRKLALKILEVISEGLGVTTRDLEREVSDNTIVVANYYPACPNPDLTFGMGQHCDPSLISILFQDVNGLQYHKDKEWVAVDPLPDALVVHMGYILEVVSNGKLKAAEHRVVTNTKTSRLSLTYLVYPNGDATIEPAECLINEVNPPIFRSVVFKELREKHLSLIGEREAMMKYLSSNMAE